MKMKLGQWTASAPCPTAHRSIVRQSLRSGQVMVNMGGTGDGFSMSQGTLSNDVYDPASGSWIAGAQFPGPNRGLYGSILLPDGRVLIWGGAQTTSRGSSSDFVISSDSWTYDPVAGTWTQVGSLPVNGNPVFSVVLASGKVLACGEVTEPNPTYPTSGPLFATSRQSFIFDPATSAWDYTRDSAGAVTQMTSGHGRCSIARMPDGKVAVVGGYLHLPGGPDYSSQVDVYDPATGAWKGYAMPAIAGEDTALSPNLGERAEASCHALASGLLLICGGEYRQSSTTYASRRSTLLFDPAAGTFATSRGAGGGQMTAPRSNHASVTLSDGSVLIISGVDSSGTTLLSTETYDPSLDQFAAGPSLPADQSSQFTAAESGMWRMANVLTDGSVLYFPDTNGNNGPQKSAFILPARSSTF